MEMIRISPTAFRLVKTTKEYKQYKLYKDYSKSRMEKPKDIIGSIMIGDKEIFYTDDARCYHYHTRYYIYEELKKGVMIIKDKDGNRINRYLSKPRLMYAWYHPEYDPFEKGSRVSRVDLSEPSFKNNLRYVRK